ncbi:hypothetical protein T11_9436 [Trichinella zimbabwensis]|uniref:Uncharacterized protein n=1 Tax=Trichinella zimbabwensis TaxID=268475 RepID=A0A0V1HM45_9BILA|nr:hypothetical protein T11_9436 [Trichinella zimbabwensis]
MLEIFRRRGVSYFSETEGWNTVSYGDGVGLITTWLWDSSRKETRWRWWWILSGVDSVSFLCLRPCL